MRRDRHAGIALAVGAVLDRAGDRVDRQPIAGPDAVGIRALDRRHAEIDAVAEEQPGEGFRQDDRDAELVQRLRRLLARGAETEIVAADHDVARPHGGCEAWIDRLEAVAGHLLDPLFSVKAWGPGAGVGDVT